MLQYRLEKNGSTGYPGPGYVGCNGNMIKNIWNTGVSFVGMGK
jgi:hypothetical protein